MRQTSQRIHTLAPIALLAALLCVLGPVAVPLGPVPLSLASLVILLAGLLLGSRDALASVAVYLAMGLVGLPVFSGFHGGLGRLLGPTGGYLLGYLPLAWCAGLGKGRRGAGRLLPLLAGTALLSLAGTLWFSLQTGTGPLSAAALTVLPFLPGDGAKVAAALALAPALEGALRRARLLK